MGRVELAAGNGAAAVSTESLPEQRGVKAFWIQAKEKVGKVVAYEGHVRAVIDMALSVNDVAVTIFDQIAESGEKVGHVLETILKSIGFISLIKDIKWWVSGKSRSACETISKVFSTTSKGIKSTVFLSSIGAFSLSKIAVKIGRIPVIGMVVSVLSIGSSVTDLIQSVQEYIKVSRDLEESTSQRANVLGKQGICLPDKIAANQYFDPKIRRLQLQKESARIEIINNVANLVLAVLVIMSFCTGWGALAATGALMLSLSLASSSINLYSYYHSERYKDDLGQNDSKREVAGNNEAVA